MVVSKSMKVESAANLLRITTCLKSIPQELTGVLHQTRVSHSLTSTAFSDYLQSKSLARPQTFSKQNVPDFLATKIKPNV